MGALGFWGSGFRDCFCCVVLLSSLEALLGFRPRVAGRFPLYDRTLCADALALSLLGVFAFMVKSPKPKPWANAPHRLLSKSLHLE